MRVNCPMIPLTEAGALDAALVSGISFVLALRAALLNRCVKHDLDGQGA